MLFCKLNVVLSVYNSILSLEFPLIVVNVRFMLHLFFKARAKLKQHVTNVIRRIRQRQIQLRPVNADRPWKCQVYVPLQTIIAKWKQLETYF